MNRKTDEINTVLSAKLDQVENDFEDLYSHMADPASEAGGDMRDRWDTARDTLEEKRSVLMMRAQRFTRAGTAATMELKKGFESAFTELKDSIRDARRKFE